MLHQIDIEPLILMNKRIQHSPWRHRSTRWRRASWQKVPILLLHLFFVLSSHRRVELSPKAENAAFMMSPRMI